MQHVSCCSFRPSGNSLMSSNETVLQCSCITRGEFIRPRPYNNGWNKANANLSVVFLITTRIEEISCCWYHSIAASEQQFARLEKWTTVFVSPLNVYFFKFFAQLQFISSTVNLVSLKSSVFGKFPITTAIRLFSQPTFNKDVM